MKNKANFPRLKVILNDFDSSKTDEGENSV